MSTATAEATTTPAPAPPASASAPAPASGNGTQAATAAAPAAESALTKAANEAAAQPTRRAPEKYGEFKLPADYQVDQAMLASYHDVARKLDLDQTQAQGLVEFHASVEQKIAEVHADQQRAMREESVKLYGGPDGKQFDEACRNAVAGFRRAGVPNEFFQDIETAGLANSPRMIALGLQLHKLLAKEDTTTGHRGPGQGAGGEAKADAEQAALRQRYPEMFNEDGTPKTF